MNARDLLAKIPQSQVLDLTVDTPPAIRLIDGDSKIIIPDLKNIVVSQQPRYIIISAPGAVGKSTLAEFMAKELRATYWDLSKIDVGASTFNGTLLDMYGPNSITEVYGLIASGKLRFIMDAFDEAEIRAGHGRIDDFLKQIHRHGKDSKQVIAVFFARTETATMMQMMLEDFTPRGSISLYEVEFFDRKRAVEMIKLRLRQKGDTRPEQHPRPFESIVSSIFDVISSGFGVEKANIWTDPFCRVFIGYAPVLQTIGDYLFTGNYKQLLASLNNSKGQLEGLKVINKFIDDILKREQEKLVNALKESANPGPKGWDGWDNIYNQEEQELRVFSKITGVSIPQRRFPELPPWLAQDYEEHVSRFLENHPFLDGSKFSSPAFQDYLCGKFLTDEELALETAKFLGRDLHLTSMFAYFYQSYSNNRCQPEHFSYLYGSMQAGIGMGSYPVEVQILRQEDGTTHKLEIVNSEDPRALSIQLSFEMNQDSRLVVNSRLYSAYIELNGKLQIGPPNGSVELKDVRINATSTHLQCRELILVGSEDDAVVIKASEFESDSYSIVPKFNGAPPFQINWPGGNQWPWVDYYQEITEAQNEEFHAETYALWRILGPFRRDRREEFAKHKDYVDKWVVGENKLMKSMIEYLKSLNIITVQGNLYFLDKNEMQNSGIYYAELNDMNLNKHLVNFLQKFKEVNANRY